MRTRHRVDASAYRVLARLTRTVEHVDATGIAVAERLADERDAAAFRASLGSKSIAAEDLATIRAAVEDGTVPTGSIVTAEDYEARRHALRGRRKGRSSHLA